MTQRDADKIFKKAFISIPIYQQSIYYFNDAEEYKSALEHIGADFNIDGIDGQHNWLVHNDTNEDMIFVFNGNKQDETLVHELTHACFALCDSMGITYSSNGSESFCYLIGFLFTKCKEKEKTWTEKY